MAILYTEEEISAVLKTLRIAPEHGKVNAEEAARILSWRAKEEQGLDYEYQIDAIRQHVRYKHFEEGTIGPNARGSRYPVEQVFRLPLAPKRRLGRKRIEQKQTPPLEKQQPETNVKQVEEEKSWWEGPELVKQDRQWWEPEQKEESTVAESQPDAA